MTPESSAGQLMIDKAAQQLPHEQGHHQHQLCDLPDAVLPAILQHVPLRSRLSACTLVCKSWAAAVASTEAEVSEYPSHPDECRQMQDWLQARGGQVCDLELHFCPDEDDDGEDPSACECSLLLPCSSLTRLTTLDLGGFRVTFLIQHSSVSTPSKQRASTAQPLAAAAMQAMPPSGPLSAAAGGSACFLPALQQLELHRIELMHAHFLQLSQLTSLTSLTLQDVTLCTTAWAPVAEQQECEAFAAVLQELQALESLELADGVVLDDPVAALAPLSTMQHLQHVSFCFEACSTASLAHLPSSLTCLDLRGFVEGVGFGDLSVTTASLSQLPSLRAAHLVWVALEPGVLAAWKGLTQLSMSNVYLTSPGVAPAGDHADDADDADDQLALTAFLEELTKLTQLQDLYINSMTGQPLLSVQNVQLLGALASSTQLTELALMETDHGQPHLPMPLPRGALQAMFSPHKRWPFLQTLRLEIVEADGYTVTENCVVDAPDIGRLANCLPGLSSLSLVHVVKDHETVAALTQLMPKLTGLSVGGSIFDDQAAGLVAQLTTLQDLEWTDVVVTAAGVQRLTALTKLDRLVINDCPAVSRHVADSKGVVELYTSRKASVAGTHDVWLQLQRRCRRDPYLRRLQGGVTQDIGRQSRKKGGS